MQHVKPIRSLMGFCLSLSMSLLSCQAPPVAPISEPLSTPNVKLAAIVDMQFDATGRLYILTINALYRVDLT
jgi:hypothetical protein